MRLKRMFVFQAIFDRNRKDELPGLQLEWIDGICAPLYEVILRNASTASPNPKGLNLLLSLPPSTTSRIAPSTEEAVLRLPLSLMTPAVEMSLQ